MDLTPLQAHWASIAKKRAIRVRIPFETALRDGRRVCADVLVQDYGAPCGMLVVSDFESIADVASALANEGYGYSCMSSPVASEIGSIEGLDSLLADWGRIR